MIKTFTHGSEDSLDHDIYAIFDRIPTFQEAKEYCHQDGDANPNILVIKDGVVVWCFKGTEDECNNSLYATYSLHHQEFEQPIKRKVERDHELKLVRTVRGLLSYFSRTELRSRVKTALRSDSWDVKFDVLKDCVLSNDTDFKKANHIEVYKFFAFQIGQTKALLEDGVELFTKSSVAEYYPELRPYLYREEVESETLQQIFQSFLTYLDKGLTSREKDLYSWQDSDRMFQFKELNKYHQGA